DFVTTKSTYTGPAAGSDLNAADIQFYVEGTGIATHHINMGQLNILFAHLYAPNGTLWTGDSSQLHGRLIAKDVGVAKLSQVSLEVGGAANIVAAPIILPAGGTYNGSVEVSMLTITSGATIHYTTDGTTPTAASAVYTAPFTLTASATVKAIAVRAGYTDSGVTSAEYTIGGLNTAPVAAFTATPTSGPVPLTVAFDASTSTDAENNITSYAWNFGDGSVGVDVTPSHVYTTPGTFTATLTVTDEFGASSTATQTITVTNTAPVAVFTATSTAGSVPLTVAFDASTSTDAENNITTYAWEFGDGATGTGVTASHDYTTPGTFTATLTVTDAGGLSSTATIAISVTNTAPTAAITVSASTGVVPFKVFLNGETSTDAENNITTYNWDFGDGATGVGQGILHEYASIGVFTVTLTVTDSGGLSSTATTTIEAVSNLPPTLQINTPEDNSFLIQNRPEIGFSYNDEKGVDTSSLNVTANGAALPVTCQLNTTFASCTPAADLPEGDVTLAATISDFEGATATASTSFFVDSIPVEVAIFTPVTGSITNQDQVTVTGAVSDNVVSLEINGVPAVLSGSGGFTSSTVTQLNSGGDQPGNRVSEQAKNNKGKPVSKGKPTDLSGGNLTAAQTTTDFTAVVNLREGKNMIVATARNINGKTGVGTADITRDIQKPIVRIDSPADGFQAIENRVTVTGIISDIVTGGYNHKVTINGIEVPVVNGTFVGVNLELGLGPNVIEAVATDAAGNEGRHSITVNYQEPAGPKLMLASGDGQQGPAGQTLIDPLTVQVLDGKGLPVAGRLVRFEVTRNNGTLSADGIPTPGRIITVPTDGLGQAQVNFTLGTTAGGGNNRVKATSAGVAGEVGFCATGLPKPPDKIISAMGDHQRGVIGEPLPIPLEIIAVDDGGNPAGGIPVTFSVIRGGGNLAGQPFQVVTTGNDGIARAVFTLGLEEGANNNVVEAFFDGLTGLSATFVASGVKPGDPANTTFRGVVLDSTQQPIPGTVVHINGTQISGVTDVDGQFLLTGVPVGPQVLHVDPSASPRPEMFPPLEFEVVTIAGIENTLDRPVILPQINIEGAKLVGGSEDVVLEMKGVPGATLTVFANSATFPDGSTTGMASVSQVHMDQVPMQPPNGILPPLAGTLQPLGAKFDPPVRVQFPNINGLPPGSITDLFQFHHDTSRFVPMGRGTVTEDGRFVISDPGFGLQTGGWHVTGPPPPPPNCNAGNEGEPAGICYELDRQNCQWVQKASEASCEDGNSCTEQDKCSAGTCRPGPKTTEDKRCVEEKECGYGDRCQDGKCAVDKKFSVGSLTIDATAPNRQLKDKVIIVKKGEKIQFTPTVTGVDCGGDPTGSNEGRLRYNWDLGDDNESPLKTVNYSYTKPGIYTVTSKVTCGECKTALQFDEITVIVVDFESKDRLVKLTIGAKSDEDVDFKITNGGVHIATAQNFLNNPLIKIYDNEDEIYSDTDIESVSSDWESGFLPDIVVVRGKAEDTYDVYTILDTTASVQIDVTVGENTASIEHSLKSDDTFKEWIDLVTQLVADITEATKDAGGGTGVGVASAFSISATAAPAETRSLITRVFITYFEIGINVPISLAKGIYNGLLQGINDDIEGLKALAAFLSSPVKAAAEIYNAVKELDGATIENILFNLTSSLLIQAEGSLTWTFDENGVAKVLATRAYIAGYVFGYLTEQAAILLTGAGIIAKVGQVIKGVLIATKGGQLILNTLDKILKFKATVLYFGSQKVKSIAEMTRLPKMIQALAEKSFAGTGFTFGEFLAERYANFKKPIERLRSTINGKWDDFGQRFMEHWADTTNRLRGQNPAPALADSSTEGFFEMVKRLIPGNVLHAERYQDFLKLVNAEGINNIPEDLAQNWFAKFRNEVDAGAAKPKMLLEGIEQLRPIAYRYVNDWKGIIKDLPSGTKGLTKHEGNGWYSTFNKYDAAADAKSALQLRPDRTGRYRIEFDMTPDIGKNTKVPYGKEYDSPDLEPVTRDFPDRGSGGATQVLVENVEIPIREIWDIGVNPPVKVFP
ncbi:MAG: PKD domain-containing protein, partial [Nitrospinota bacterium]|nr:PKD domain-containing protein [Nitrospinota bacterium]